MFYIMKGIPSLRMTADRRTRDKMKFYYWIARDGGMREGERRKWGEMGGREGDEGGDVWEGRRGGDVIQRESHPP